MGSRWLRIGMLVVGCVMLLAGCRLFYLIYCGDLFPGDDPPAERATRSPSVREDYLSPDISPVREGAALTPGDETVPVPSPPVLAIVTAALPMGVVGSEYRQELEAVGVLGPGSWTITGGELPSGLELSPDGVISGIPEEAGEWRFRVRLAERSGRAVRKDLRLLVRERFPGEGEVLRIVTESLAPGRLGRGYLQELVAAGGELPYFWFLEGGLLPEALRFNPAAGVIFGVPGEAGTFQLTVGVTDLEETLTFREYTLEIEEGEIEIITDALPPAVKGEPYSLTLRARGGVGPYTWELVTGRLPDGLRFDRDRGIVSGLPEKWETTSFLIRVTDRDGRSAEKEFELAVTTDYDRAVDFGGLRIVTGTLPNAVQGQVYSARLEADGGVTPYIWTVSNGDLPPSLFLEADVGKIGGIPERIGKSDFTVMVSDSRRRTARQEFSLAVNLQLVFITTGSLETAVSGLDYSEVIEATGGTPPYIFSLELGELPAGLALGSDGLLQGIISDIYAGQGPLEFIFRVRAEDQSGRYDIAEFRLAVRDTAEPTPVLSSTPAPSPSPSSSPDPGEGLQIITTSLPRGVVEVEYRAAVAAAGGEAPYSWSFSPLPEGLSGSSEGIISGRPLAASSNEVEVAVADQAGSEASRTLSLIIEEVAGVQDALGAPGDGKAGLAWLPPAGADFREVQILRKRGGYPLQPGDGVEVYRGRGTNFVDLPLENDQEYFYGLIAYREDGRHSGIGPGSQVRVIPRAVSLFGKPDPYADEVISFRPLTSSTQDPGIALGPPRGGGAYQGSFDVISLHARENGDNAARAPYGGTIILKFTDNLVVDGEGGDFTVFENAFLIRPEYQIGADAVRFMEPGVVAVSQDGKIWREFPFNYRPSFFAGGGVNFYNPYSYHYGFAGINPVFSNNASPDPTNPAVSGGDTFDLADLPGRPFTWIQYVRITSTGDRWLLDVDGDEVRHPDLQNSLSGSGSSGFDLDALCAINY